MDLNYQVNNLSRNTTNQNMENKPNNEQPTNNKNKYHKNPKFDKQTKNPKLYSLPMPLGRPWWNTNHYRIFLPREIAPFINPSALIP